HAPSREPRVPLLRRHRLTQTLFASYQKVDTRATDLHRCPQPPPAIPQNRSNRTASASHSIRPRHTRQLVHSESDETLHRLLAWLTRKRPRSCVGDCGTSKPD